MGADFRILSARLSSPDYNCSAHTPEDWARLYGERQLAMGTWYVLIALTSLVAYVPLIRVFSGDNKLNCVKIMRVLAIVDMLGIFFAGFLFGIQMFLGAVFCSHKAFILIDGMSALGNEQCIANVMFCSQLVQLFISVYLSIDKQNRGVDGKRSLFSGTLRIGSRCSVLMAIAIFYGVTIVFFTPPTLSNPKLQSMLLCPAIPGVDFTFDKLYITFQYANYHHRFHNGLVSVTIPLLFLILYRLVSNISTGIATKSNNTKKLQAMIFTQGAIVSECKWSNYVNASGAIMWIAFNNFTMPQSFIALSMIMYQLVHASPCLVYMLVNQSVREESMRLLGMRKKSIEAAVVLFTVSTSTVSLAQHPVTHN